MLSATATRGAEPTTTFLPDDEWFTRWRRAELGRIDQSGTTYLDYTGAALYPESLVRRDADRLAGAVLGNPHSDSGPSLQATGDLEAARSAILGFLNADPGEYVAILTANTTAACKLVAESFAFGPDAPYIGSLDNHNSINGIREYARRAGAGVHTIPLDGALRLRDAAVTLARYRGREAGLVAFPAQSNFSGVRHPLSLVSQAQSLGYRVLLDAAAFVPTAMLDLTTIKPDFVALSLYKIAGYPTGLGALVARRDALEDLRRPWFSGGTVDWVTIGSGRHQLRRGAEQFEDGTPSFLAAGAVRSALAGVVYADRERLSRHLGTLTATLLDRLVELRHANGERLATIHGPEDTRDRGATVAITLRDATGDAIPFWDVEPAARAQQIALRGGCFCNPGCAEEAFGLHDVDRCLDEMGDGFTIPRFAECVGGKPVGAIRISMGLGTVARDVERVMEFLGGYVC